MSKKKFPHNATLVESYRQTQDIRIKNKFIEYNIPLIKNIIEKKFRYPNYLDDLLQEGRLALSKALDKYDPERGNISTLCYWSIMNRLKTFMSKTNLYGNRKKKLEPVDNSEDILLNIQYSPGTRLTILEKLMDNLDTEDKELIRNRFGFNGKRKIGKMSAREHLAIDKFKEVISSSEYELEELLQDF